MAVLALFVMAPMRMSRLAGVTPHQIIGWALAWPIVLVVGTFAYVALLVWPETGGQLAAIGLGWSGSSFGIVAALAVLLLPPMALILSWHRARRRLS
ncbi:MAG: hypothetical protein JWM95_1514 [Gemmatimonadetes bacterium]|nr:hypothetical protein [Gemmatimonadota bacterium]